jgi:CDP-glucose 4,6-dehydratase
VTRCGNFYGGYDFTFSRIIPGTIRNICLGQPPALRSNGRFTRDFLYIEDAVDAQLLLAERVTENPALWGEAFNFSYELQIEAIDIVQMILRKMQSTLVPEIQDDVVAETPHVALSSEKARRELRWRPTYGFTDGLSRTVDWYTGYFGAVRAWKRGGFRERPPMIPAHSG